MAISLEHMPGWLRWQKIWSAADEHELRMEIFDAYNHQVDDLGGMPSGEERYMACAALLEGIMDAIVNPKFSLASAADEYEETVKAMKIMDDLR